MSAFAASASAQISEDYLAGDPSGWTNRPGDVNSWQIGRQIDGTEGPTPHPITGGAGPSVLTYNIREPVPAGDEWSFFQHATRDFSFSRSQYDTHVVWLEFSTFANMAVSGQETVKWGITFEDEIGVGVQLQNLWNTKSGSGYGGSRTNQAKPRLVVLQSDGEGGVLTDPQTGLPLVDRDVDGNDPGVQHVWSVLNFDAIQGSQLFGTGVEPDDDDPNDADGDQRVLNTLFEQNAVVRLNDYENYNFEVEWRSLNPDASGDSNWRSLRGTDLGAGTEFETPDEDFSLIPTQPIRDITAINLFATRRDISGEEGGILPSIVRAEANINTNQSSTDGVPDEAATANQQIGMGKFVAHVLHTGDLNRDGQVTSADVTGSPLLGNLGATTVEDPSIQIGDPMREVSWVDG
ncbi:hypothetical protein, partial [Botrimarina sp.]|uniref:hypothetical protein n=1 Tax=Botrimarina sp. TaxID=2795802 RepID=UPI0032ED1A0D